MSVNVQPPLQSHVDGLAPSQVSLYSETEDSIAEFSEEESPLLLPLPPLSLPLPPTVVARASSRMPHLYLVTLRWSGNFPASAALIVILLAKWLLTKITVM